MPDLPPPDLPAPARLSKGRGGPAGSVRTAVVWEILSAVLAAAASRAGGELSVVDAGWGTGGFAVPLAEAGYHVTVVDPSPDSLASLQRRIADRDVADRVVGVQGDLNDLPSLVPAGSADLVLCHSVLEMVDDPASALRAVGGVLRPGGRLSLLVASRAAAVLARALAGRPEEASHALTDPAGRWGPGDSAARRWTPETLQLLITQAGLHVEQIHGVRVVADLIPAALLDSEPGAASALLALERALSGLPPFCDIATQLHVLARRP